MEKKIVAVIPYGSGKIVLLPQKEEEYKTEDVWKENGKKYLDSLFELNRRLKITDEERWICPDGPKTYIY